MDFRQLLLSQHARTHSTMIGPTDLPLEDMVLSELSDEQIRLRPHAGSNSIAWLLWHMARCEDVAVNLIVAERLQVVDETDWPRRLNVARRDIGTGMTDDEVNALSANVDIAALRAYRAEVGRRTQEVIRCLPLEELQRTVDATLMATVVAAGAFGPNIGWMADFWTGRPKEFLLSFTAIGHSYTQLGEAYVLRGLMGKTAI